MSIRIRTILLILAAFVVLVVMAGFILLILVVQSLDGYSREFNVSKYHIQKYNLPETTYKHIAYGCEILNDPDRHVEAIFFDPKEVKQVKEKYAQEEYPWFEYPSSEQGKKHNFIWLNRIIQADLPHKYSAKDHFPELLGWGEHMICSIGSPEKLMDTKNGILWLVKGSSKIWKVN